MSRKNVFRRNGRILAIQALYAYDVGQARLEDLLKLEWADYPSDDEEDEAVTSTPDSGAFACFLIAGTIEHIQEIDTKIADHLAESWDFERLNRVSLAILRISIFEILYQKELDYAVVIDEAIDISKLFLTDESFKFINAILDTISKEEIK